jgi:cell division protein FtsB
MKRAVRALLVLVTVGGIVFLFILPGRTWLAQGRATSVAQRQETALSQENAALTKQVSLLQQPAYIEQVARAEYGLTMPGEEAFGILPPTAPPTTVPRAPAPKPHHHDSFWAGLEFWN